jgi:hypothetical protein
VAGELDLVSRDLALVRHLHRVALHRHRHVERDLVALDLAVGDLHVTLTSGHGAGELVAGGLEVEGHVARLPVASGHLRRPLARHRGLRGLEGKGRHEGGGENGHEDRKPELHQFSSSVKPVC